MMNEPLYIFNANVDSFKPLAATDNIRNAISHRYICQYDGPSLNTETVCNAEVTQFYSVNRLQLKVVEVY